jgi:hypothetical protein
MGKKIVVRIDSGLGNQLFQYACGYSVARNKGFKLILDPYFRDDVRTYQLDNFNIDYDCFFVNRMIDEWLQ